MSKISRRSFVKNSVFGGLGLSLFGGSTAIGSPLIASAIEDFGELLPPDGNGLMLPPGFTGRIIAISGRAVTGTNQIWHNFPDGGATFATEDGGWIYVSNAEIPFFLGGVNAVRFDAQGNIVDAYPILRLTNVNCAGGPTPWGTWLSCEEVPLGEVWECDPYTPNSQGIVRPAMGKFKHEAAAVDPVHKVIYLTEDESDGLLYRFIPDNYPDLSSGRLEAAEILDPQNLGSIAPGQIRGLAWHTVPRPQATIFNPTRNQVPEATRFNGGEGCWYENGLVYFTTKGSNRVWKIDTVTQEISIFYDLATSSNPELSGVDNVCVSASGDVFVAEDGGNMQIVGLTSSGIVKPVVQIPDVPDSEITGPALSPDGTRLYFSSQRNPGVTYEVTGPWVKEPTSPAEENVPMFNGIAAGLMAATLALVVNRMK